MAITLDGTTGITTPGLTNTGTETIVNLTTTGNTILGDASTDTLNVGNGGLVKDASGNLGIGVTPSAWRTAVGTKALQIGGSVALFSQESAGTYWTTLTSNAFQNTSNVNAYINTGFATSYTQTSGQHIWGIAPSGTAGNAITFTQAMTLDASSNLTVTGSVSGGGVFNIVGSGAAPASGYGIRTKSGLGTEIVSAYKIGFSVNSGTSDAMTLNDSGILTVSTPGTITNGAIKIQGATTDYQGLSLYYAASSPNASARAWQIAPNYIGYARLDFLISSSSSTDPITSKGYIDGTTGAYVAVSDLRAKKNIADCSYGLAEVLAMRPVIYNMIEEEDGTDKHLGFIAQEIKKVVNEAVSSTSTEEELYGLDKAGLIPILVKAIQEQQAMIDELKAKVAALEAA
jgi:hypothetical protein